MPFGGDCCIGFFAEAWAAGVLPLASGARVLEIGSAEYDFLSDFARERPDLDLVGLDWRRVSHPQAIQADVLTYDFPPASFDAVISISTLEHIGLGSYDSDPLDADGDSRAIQRAWGWLKPGGWLYFDVPYRPDGPYAVHGNFRAYDPVHFEERFAVTPRRVETYRRIHDLHLADAPYISVVWEKPHGVS